LTEAKKPMEDPEDARGEAQSVSVTNGVSGCQRRAAR
jgi:hypothetical protein